VAREPGWYDDPEGLPGVYRWWDGSTWTVDVTTDPNAVAPGDEAFGTEPEATGPEPAVPTRRVPAAPAHEPAGADPPADEAAPPDEAALVPEGRRPTRSPAGGRWVARLIALAVVIGLLIGAATAVRSLLDIDLPDTGDIDIPDFSDLGRGPGSDGRYDGGGLSYDAVQGRWTRTLLASNVPMSDLDGEETLVTRSADGTPQYAYVWLGKVEPTLVVEGDLEATTDRFADRFATRLYPADARLDEESTRPIRLDGTNAVRLTRTYAYRVRGTPITGEELSIVVVDVGATPAVLMATVPNGFPAVRAQARRAITSLRVD
jgi:Protein of unknown function (DUF2510)